MDKEFIHNLEDGCYYVLDVLNQQVLPTNSRGKFVPYFKPSISGVSRRQVKYNNQQSISYTPHQNKYFGYCQCPNEKIKHQSASKVEINNISTDQVVLQTRNSLPINKANCFNKPKTPKIKLQQIDKEQKLKVSEQSFDLQKQSHLSGTIIDAQQVYQSGTIQCLNYRKGTLQLEKSIQLKNKEDDNLRYTCRYLNQKKVKSPPFALLQKYNIIEKINIESTRKFEKQKNDSLIKRIPQNSRDGKRISHRYHSEYKNVDISLNESIESQRIRAYLSQR